MKIQRCRCVRTLAVPRDTHTVIYQKFFHSRDLLRIYQCRAGEKEIVGPADLLEAKFLLFHKGTAEHFIPGPVVESIENILRHIVIIKYLFLRKILFPHGCMFIRKKLKVLMPAAHLTDTDIRLCLVQTLCHPFQQTGLKEIIGIQKHQIFSLCLFHSMVSGSTAAGIFLLKKVKTTVFFHIFTDDLHRTITGTIIHAKYFHLL